MLKTIAVTTCAVVLMAGDNCSSTTTSRPPQGWINIKEPVEESTYSTTIDIQRLAGNAFVSPGWNHCCPFDAAVIVTWSNSATGDSGTATSVSTLDFLGFAFHDWSAFISLACGENEIEVSALDPDGLMGLDSINVKSTACP